MLQSQNYNVTINGITPLIMHNDNLSWSDSMKEWGKDPNNKKISVAGDDRFPAWRWMGYLYWNNGEVCIPADNIMTMLREGGAKCPTGKRGATFKRQTQSGIIVNEAGWTLETHNGVITKEQVESLINNPSMEEQEKVAKELGFMLFIKRAKIGQNKHVRVRPRFDSWSAQGSILVLDETITEEILNTILTLSGQLCGLCDWRPSSPKAPGSFGKFEVKIEKERG